MLLRLLLALITVVNFQVLTHTTAIAAAQSTQTIRGTITDRTTLQPLIGAEVLEGVDIPNPNHFARRGSSGGGITIFSISMLADSDFIPYQVRQCVQ